MSCHSSTADYLGAVRATFASLKRPGAPPIALRGGGRLVPVTEEHAADAALIESLTRWREASAFAFPLQAEVTAEGTARWLRMGLLDPEDRMLWLVLPPGGSALGHVGYANALNDRRELEVDNVVRGEQGHAGIMSAAMRAVTGWAREALEPAAISLKVFADNTHAVAFYARLGWEEERRTPLRRSEEEGRVYYDVADAGEPADRELIRMVLR
jgi:perosamine synthetase